jgi:hypothetical protein
MVVLTVVVKDWAPPRSARVPNATASLSYPWRGIYAPPAVMVKAVMVTA